MTRNLNVDRGTGVDRCPPPCLPCPFAQESERAQLPVPGPALKVQTVCAIFIIRNVSRMHLFAPSPPTLLTQSRPCSVSVSCTLGQRLLPFSLHSTRITAGASAISSLKTHAARIAPVHITRACPGGSLALFLSNARSHFCSSSSEGDEEEEKGEGKEGEGEEVEGDDGQGLQDGDDDDPSSGSDHEHLRSKPFASVMHAKPSGREHVYRSIMLLLHSRVMVRALASNAPGYLLYKQRIAYLPCAQSWFVCDPLFCSPCLAAEQRASGPPSSNS